MKIADLISESWKTTDSKGFHEKTRGVRVYESLFHSEISEMVEEHCNNKPALYENWGAALNEKGQKAQSHYDHHGDITTDYEGFLPKPEGMQAELVDLLIRWGDYMGGLDPKYVGSIGQRDTTEIAAEFRKSGEPQEVIDYLTMDEPLEFAAVLHRQISEFGNMTEQGNTGVGLAVLSLVVPFVLFYFDYRGWDFEKVYRLKADYNARRPRMHGGKAA